MLNFANGSLVKLDREHFLPSLAPASGIASYDDAAVPSSRFAQALPFTQFRDHLTLASHGDFAQIPGYSFAVHDENPPPFCETTGERAEPGESQGGDSRDVTRAVLGRSGVRYSNRNRTIQQIGTSSVASRNRQKMLGKMQFLC